MRCGPGEPNGSGRKGKTRPLRKGGGNEGFFTFKSVPKQTRKRLAFYEKKRVEGGNIRGEVGPGKGEVAKEFSEGEKGKKKR